MSILNSSKDGSLTEEFDSANSNWPSVKSVWSQCNFYLSLLSCLEKSTNYARQKAGIASCSLQSQWKTLHCLTTLTIIKAINHLSNAFSWLQPHPYLQNQSKACFCFFFTLSGWKKTKQKSNHNLVMCKMHYSLHMMRSFRELLQYPGWRLQRRGGQLLRSFKIQSVYFFL